MGATKQSGRCAQVARSAGRSSVRNPALLYACNTRCRLLPRYQDGTRKEPSATVRLRDAAGSFAYVFSLRIIVCKEFRFVSVGLRPLANALEISCITNAPAPNRGARGALDTI